MVKHECIKCGGKGEIAAYRAIAGGTCFSCNGTGYKEYKSAPKQSFLFQVAVTLGNGSEWVENKRGKSEKAAIASAKKSLYFRQNAPVFASGIDWDSFRIKTATPI